VEAKIMKFEQTDRPEVLDDARRDLDAAESLGPDSPSVRLAAGLLKRTAGQYEEALDDYRRVVDRLDAEYSRVGRQSRSEMNPAWGQLNKECSFERCSRHWYIDRGSFRAWSGLVVQVNAIQHAR
jgi:hypothetical protein